MHIIAQKTDILQGVITPPASKSEAIRALIFALLCNGTSHIHNMLDADDVDDAVRACETLGATVLRFENTLTITSTGAPFSITDPCVYTGNSGLTTRLILPLLGLRSTATTPIALDCGLQMRQRPMSGLCQALNQAGMEIDETRWPIIVSGTLTGGTIALNEPISQFASALLMALPLAEHNSTVTLPNIPAWSYVEMTLAWLNQFNIRYTHHQNTITIPGQQRYEPFTYTLPGDFSSASFFIAAGVLFQGTIRLKGLDMSNAQGDKELVNIITKMGGDIRFDNHDMIIQGGKPLQGISIDASAIPDLLPTLAVLGTVATGQTSILNVPQARLKETDRIHSMTEGLIRMGARIQEKSDGMIIHPSTLTGASVFGYGDHRTVMALSLAGMLARGETLIDDAECVSKTFPQFVDEMKSLGAQMDLIR